MVVTRAQSDDDARKGAETSAAQPAPASKRRKRSTSSSSSSTTVRKATTQLEPPTAKPSLSSTHDAPSPRIHARSAAHYGLIQERLVGSPGSQEHVYALLVQSILWNQTHGRMALPVLVRLLELYPDPGTLAHARQDELAALLRPIGLYRQRAARLIALAEAWVRAPPCAGRRYRKLGYPCKGDGRDVRPGEILGEEDNRRGWEVAHLPGIGRYALDSYRIFCRDGLRGVESEESPEWKSVVLGKEGDKDLRAYLVWRWAKEGSDWDSVTGKLRELRAP